MRKKGGSYRYSIGIDLGTSNCALSYVRHTREMAQSKILHIPQWETEERSAYKEILPSFAFMPAAFIDTAPVPEWKKNYIVGILGREQALEAPQRVIHSAKSWLCHQGIDRHSKILPWQSAEIGEEQKLSPVEASSLYLSYLRAVWNQEMAAQDTANAFDKQLIVITVPASFDQDAQKLTLEAAQLADAVLYAIQVVPITNDAGRNLGGENALAGLAAGTGGRVFIPSAAPEIDAAFSEILAELRTQYFLGYYPRNLPPGSERFHRVEVGVRRPGLRVLARSGYYGDVESPSVALPQSRGPALEMKNKSRPE